MSLLLLKRRFTPTSISSLTGWYDFGDKATLFTDTGRTALVVNDGDLIGSVTDKSGGGRHLTRGGIAGTEPVYKVGIQAGKSIARGDGNKWLLSGATFAADTKQTVIVCVKNPGAATILGVWARSDSTNNRLTGTLNNASNVAQATIGTGAGSYSETWTSPPAAFIVISTVVNNTGAVSQLYGNGTLQSSATGVPAITPATSFALMSRQIGSLTSGLNSDLAEALVFNDALSATDRGRAENYMRARWATG